MKKSHLISEEVNAYIRGGIEKQTKQQRIECLNVRLDRFLTSIKAQIMELLNRETQEARKPVNILEQSLRHLHLPNRAHTQLNSRYSTVAELCKQKPNDLLAIRAFGHLSLRAVEKALAQHGLKLADE